MTYVGRFGSAFLTFLLLFWGGLFAEEGVLIIHVVDTQDRPIRGVRVSTRGDGSISPPSDNIGKTRIRLAPQTRPNSEVSLLIASTPKNMVLISPWDGRVRIPPFENESQNYVSIVLAERSSRELLTNPKALTALAARINSGNVPTSSGDEVTPEQRRAVLEEQARAFGLKPDEVDRAIREWGRKTNDPYEKGLAALYAENYEEATSQLSESLRLRQSELKTAHSKVVEAASFLGQSLDSQGKYREAADAFRKAVALRPNDDGLLNRLGLSLTEAGNYTGAEPILKRALYIRERLWGVGHPLVAQSLNSLAVLYGKVGKYDEAARFLERSLEISEKALGSEHMAVGFVVNNLAAAYWHQGKYGQAEALLKRSLAIHEKTFGSEHLVTATLYSNLGEFYRSQKKYTEAEPFFKRSLIIRERNLAADHPAVASSLNEVGMLYWYQGKYAEAEPLLKKSLRIRQKELGSEHREVGQSFNNLALLYVSQSRYAEAEPLYEKSLAICEKALGPEHDNVASVLENYARLLRRTNRPDEALKMETRAKAIRDTIRNRKPK